MTALWTAAEAARATGGSSNRDWRADGVSIDTRSLRPGDLFVCIEGPRVDGHDFAAEALAKGAAAVMIHRDLSGLDEQAPVLRVAQTERAMERLGAAARARSKARVMALTGSVGKTSNKEALRLSLSQSGETHATEGNLNNHWGVPLSLARLPRSADYAVFELGMNHAREIAPLSQQVQPEVALITTVAAVHIENFNSVEGIADAKSEIFEGLTPGGVAILNRDNEWCARCEMKARALGVRDIRFFSTRESADARLLEADVRPDGSQVRAEIRGRRLSYRIGAPGAHWIANSLAVLLCVDALGADVVRAAESLATLEAVKGRGKPIAIALPRGGAITVLDEAYNASPPSMQAAFQVLAMMAPGPGGRRIAVVGDMLEQGDHAPALHKGLREPLLAAAPDLVFAAGPVMRLLFETLPAQIRGAHAATAQALAPLVAHAVRDGDIVLVKGSAGTKMNAVIEKLREGGSTINV
jgi:UDP-N-acetylmuramoyl-tripeptide--D-alanyl-D-alanine ligase